MLSFIVLVTFITGIFFSIALFYKIMGKIARIDIKKADLKPGDLNGFQQFIRTLFFGVRDMTPEQRAAYEKEKVEEEEKRYRRNIEQKLNEIKSAIYYR